MGRTTLTVSVEQRVPSKRSRITQWSDVVASLVSSATSGNPSGTSSAPVPAWRVTLTDQAGQRYVSEWLYSESEADELRASLTGRVEVGALNEPPAGFTAV